MIAHFTDIKEVSLIGFPVRHKYKQTLDWKTSMNSEFLKIISVKPSHQLTYTFLTIQFLKISNILSCTYHWFPIVEVFTTDVMTVFSYVYLIKWWFLEENFLSSTWFRLHSRCKEVFQVLSLLIFQFMIEENQDQRFNDRANLTQDYINDYWLQHYTVNPKLVPTFLDPYSEKILKTGKYLNVVHHCREFSSRFSTLSWCEFTFELKNSVCFFTVTD